MGVFISMSMLLLRRRLETPFSSWVVGVVGFASWLILVSTYVDAAIILVLFILLSLPIYFFLNKEVFKDILRIIPVTGLMVLLATPVLTYATFLTFDLRLRAATGTGIPSAIWALPSEILGFVDVFSQNSITRSIETTVLGILITSSIFWQILKKLQQKNLAGDFAVLGATGFLTIGIGFVLSYTGKLHSNYIYTKVSVYVAPIIIIVWIASLKTPKSVVGNKTSSSEAKAFKFASSGYISLLLIISLIAVTSSYVASRNIATQGTEIPYTFAKLSQDKTAQRELAKYNYLTPYILSANYLGVIGNVHWISKATNDIELKNRLDVPLRLICYSIDTNCKPTTPRIPNARLESFGLIQYQSPLSTRQFAALSPKDRYKENFLVFGMTPIAIADRFIGGNPYYN